MNTTNMRYPIKAIQIVQNEDSSLHIAEIEIYQEINGTNIAINNSNINCSSFDQEDEIESDLIDGDLETFSHSTNAIKGTYDVCIFDEHIYNVTQIKVYPRDAWWDRSNNMTLNIYGNAFIGDTYDENPLLFTDLFHSFDISHQDTGYWGTLARKT